jgi:hypothetical protein
VPTIEREASEIQAESEENILGVVVDEAGKYKISWSNGVSIEIVGLLRNPRESKSWFRPDGTPFEQPSAEVVSDI